MTAQGVILAIMDMASAKSDANVPKKNVLVYCNEKVTKTPKIGFKNV